MFDKFFEVFLADTPEGKKEHYHIRYKVYCEEMGFEDKENFSSAQEQDEWDDHSVHFLVRHKETQQWVGAMRMVFQNNKRLPLQDFCPINQDHGENKSIEISRLCLIKDIRRRNTDVDHPLDLNNKADKQNEQENVTDLYSRRHINLSLIWGLFRAASIYSEKHQIDNWYFLGTKALARIVSREGFAMKQVGDGCDHRGKRYPFEVNLDEILANNIWSKDFNMGYRLYSELQYQAVHDVEELVA